MYIVKITIVLPVYYTEKYKTKKDKTFLVGMNWYRNAHFILNNKVKHSYHEIIKKKVNNIKFKRIILTYRVYIKRKGTDGHNIRSIIEKFLLDGLVESKAIKNDSTPDFVLEDKGTKYFIDKLNPRMEIDIEEV